jgi:parvulin-like peptidyl-prolyl isomerase
MTPEKRDTYKKDALENLVVNELLYREALRMELEVDKARLKETRKATIKKFGGKKRFKAQLKRRGLTDKQYRMMLKKRFLIAMIKEKEITEKSAVTNDVILEFYNKNKSSYVRPEARRIWHVLVEVPPAATDDVRLNRRKRAEEVLAKAREGEDLARLAWDYSDEPQAVKGGDHGLVHKGRLLPDVEKVTFELEKGQFSDVIETIYGYHILKVLDIVESQHLSFEDVSRKIQKKIYNKNIKQRTEALISELKAKAEIEVFE